MKKFIEIKDFYYQDLFRDLNLIIDCNQMIALSGPNNCGKTTLLRILNREIIVEGEITVDGNPINSYPISEYSKRIECVIPFEKIKEQPTTEEELLFHNNNAKEVEEICKTFKLQRMKKKKIESLSKKEFLLYQVATSLSKKPKLLLLDGFDVYLEEEEREEFLENLREYQKKHNLSILYTTLHLKDAFFFDKLIVLSEGKVKLQGTPKEVLEHDNVLSKMGLRLPFMVDLSVKLKDYDLLEEIELDQNRMVDILWK